MKRVQRQRRACHAFPQHRQQRQRLDGARAHASGEQRRGQRCSAASGLLAAGSLKALRIMAGGCRRRRLRVQMAVRWCCPKVSLFRFIPHKSRKCRGTLAAIRWGRRSFAMRRCASSTALVPPIFLALHAPCAHGCGSRFSFFRAISTCPAFACHLLPFALFYSVLPRCQPPCASSFLSHACSRPSRPPAGSM